MRADQQEHQRRVRAAVEAANHGRRSGAGQPAFHVVLATDYNGNGCNLRWETNVHESPDFPRQRILARFACSPVPLRHDGGPLLPPVVELSVETARALLDACNGAPVTDEAVAELRQALRPA